MAAPTGGSPRESPPIIRGYKRMVRKEGGTSGEDIGNRKLMATVSQNLANFNEKRRILANVFP